MLPDKKSCKSSFLGLLKNMPLGYQSLDNEGRFIEVNDTLCDMLEYSKEELLGQWFGKFLDEESLKTFIEGFPKIKKAGHYRNLKLSMKQKSNNIIHLEFDGKICYDENGYFLHTHCIVRDTTSQINSQNALKQSEELFKCLVDNSPNGILYFDTEGNIIYANSNLLKIVGSPSLEETKKINLLTFKNLIEAKVSDAVGYAIEKKIVVRHECLYKSIWGKESYLRFSITPILEEQGNIDRLMAIVEDISENKSAEKKLKESENKYRTVADYTSEWEYWMDNNQNYHYISPACKEVTGYSAEEFYANLRLFNEIIYSKDKNLISDHDREVFKNNKKLCHLKFRIITKEKKLKWIEHKCRPVYDNEGNNLGRRGTNSDITEMQEALEKVRINQKNYFNIFEGVSDGIIYVKKNGMVQDVNSGFIKITGIDRRQVIQRHAVVLAREFLKKNVLKTVMAIIASNLNGKQTNPFELEYKNRLLHITTKTAIDDEGVIGVLRDVTELRNAENLLRESENKFRKVLENVQLLAIMLDMEGRITFCNDYYLKITGYTREELLNERWIKTFIPLEKREEIRNIFDDALKEKVLSYQIESEIITKTNERLIIAWNNTIIKDNRNIVVGITGIGTDLTQTREKEIIDRNHLELTARLQKALSASEVYRICLEFVLEITQYESGAIYMRHEDIFTVQYHTGVSEKFLESVKNIPMNPMLENYLNQGVQIIIPEQKKSDKTIGLFEKAGFLSGAIIPFKLLDEQIGTINIASKKIKEINPLKTKLLKSALEIIQFSIHKALSEEQLFQSSNRYRSVVKSLAEGVIVYDRYGQPVTVNDSAESIIGLSKENILKISIFDEDLKAVKVDSTFFSRDEYPVIKTLRTGKPEHEVIMGLNRRPSGELFWISVNTQPIYDEAGEMPSSVVMSFFDITMKLKTEKEISNYRSHLENLVRERTIKLEKEIEERKKVEDALRESESHYRLLTENAHDMILRYVYLPVPGYEYVSPACFKLTGYTANDFYSDPNMKTKLIHPEDIHLLELHNLKNLQPGESIELRLVHKNGTTLWVEENLQLFFDEEGNIKSREGIVRDITLRKASEFKILENLKREKELSELKSRFISTVSHEFRTPLTTVLSSSELIQKYSKGWGEEKLNLHSERILRSIDYLTNLLDDILLVSLVEAEEISYNPSDTNFKQLCEKVIETLYDGITPSHNIKFEYHSDKKIIRIDSQLAKIILTNLLSNAIKYSPMGGDIILSVSVNEILHIAVSDTGMGISEKDKDKIADSFYRSENVLGIRGTGLGLSIVKRAVDLHKGKYELKSELGKGTEVIVELPIISVVH